MHLILYITIMLNIELSYEWNSANIKFMHHFPNIQYVTRPTELTTISKIIIC